MKIESLVQFTAPESRLEVYPDGMESAAVFCGERKVLSIGRVKTGNFDESLGLAEKLRKHFANDRLSGEADSVNVIPFGCEYHIRRHWKFAGNCGELTDDINADNGGRINDLFLEEVFFPGEAESVEIIFAGESGISYYPADGVIYDGEKLPMLVKVVYRDGLAAEFYCGDDLWRHRCSENYPGGTARHTIEADADGVRWTRHVLIMPEETETEKRPWRFKMLFAVGRNGEKAALPAGAELTQKGCFAAPAMRRDLHAFIRKCQEKSAVLQISGMLCCTDGSHIDRPGREILHGMLGELFDGYIWAAGMMAKKQGDFHIVLDVPELAVSVIAANLRKMPEKMFQPEEI